MAKKTYRADGSHASFNDSRIGASDGTFEVGLLTGLQELTIKDSLEIGEERAAGSPFVQEFTTGDYSAEGSAVFLAESWDLFRDKLTARGIGFMGTLFNLNWQYERKDKKTTTITLESVLFTERERSGKSGSEALKVNVSIKILKPVLENGVDPFGKRK